MATIVNITLLDILMILSLSYMIMYIEGPFGIFSRIRNYLMLDNLFGVFFYKLFSCAYCSGFWSGSMTYCILHQSLNILNIIAFGLAGAIISLIGNYFI